MKVAALITSYNRCDMTLNSVSCLYRQSIETDIYIVDGGSSDYTVSKIKAQYKDVNIKVIDGLYWAGGMREAWKWAANEEQYDYYLLLNDDTTLYDNALDLLLADAEKGLEIYKMPVIVVGTTIDNVTKQFSYGGRRLIAKGKSTSTIVYPNADCLG